MDGIFVINKPKGITSHDVVDAIRRRFNTKRVGHAGTLDPMATGVLVILVGKATKLSDSFMQRDKEYVATLFLGKSTDTQDSTGKTLETRPLNGIEAGLVRKTLNSFLGEIEQIPPMVSAKKYKGKKLYELARKGKSVPRKPCMIKIHEIELLSFNLPEFVFRVKCSKGTYVRTLCESIGKAMGYPAHMSGLVRTMSGEFGLKEAKELDAASEKDLRAV